MKYELLLPAGDLNRLKFAFLYGADAVYIGGEYYSLLYIAGDRTILDTNTYQDVCNAVDALKESKATKFYFAPNNPFEPDIERFYQLKFKGVFNGVEYRNMAD